MAIGDVQFDHEREMWVPTLRARYEELAQAARVLRHRVAAFMLKQSDDVQFWGALDLTLELSALAKALGEEEEG